jgi:hypothetical protein
MMVVAGAQYQVTNASGTVIDWTNMNGAFNLGDLNNVVVSATLDTTSLRGTYTVIVRGMAAGPKSGSGPNYPLNGQWSSDSTQLIVTEPKGYVNGTVRNTTGAVIPGAIVITNTEVSVITDSNGNYSLNLAYGSYQLTASKNPEYYSNNSISVTASEIPFNQNIVLNKKLTGTISGKVTVK